MIEPNFTNLLWIILIYLSIHSIALIYAGSKKMKKDTEYGIGDIFAGIAYIIIILYFVLMR